MNLEFPKLALSAPWQLLAGVVVLVSLSIYTAAMREFGSRRIK